MKINPVKFELTRATGLHAECGNTETVDNEIAANAVLCRWAKTAPKGGGYDKIDFKITFADGMEYTGTYDLDGDSHPDLFAHIRSLAGCYSGRVKPAWMVGHLVSLWEKQKAMNDQYGWTQKWGALMDTYELGLWA